MAKVQLKIHPFDCIVGGFFIPEYSLSFLWYVTTAWDWLGFKPFASALIMKYGCPIFSLSKLTKQCFNITRRFLSVVELRGFLPFDY